MRNLHNNIDPIKKMQIRVQCCGMQLFVGRGGNVAASLESIALRRDILSMSSLSTATGSESKYSN